MKKISFILFASIVKFSFAQTPVDVTEQTLKVGGGKEEVMYFGFAEGDKIIFNVTEADKKEIKEIEVLEYPSSSKFSDYKTAKVENKIINVNKKAVYKFRFYNSNIFSGRICKIKIQRIPVSEATKNFNSTVNWITKQDTSWNTYTKDIIVSYDTSYEQKTKREIVKSEEKEELIMDKNQAVHSQTNDNGNKDAVFFTLPLNQLSGNQTSKVISWAYWVGVGEGASQAWQQNMQVVSGLAKGAAAIFTSPLGALAVGAVTDLVTPKGGDIVTYGLCDQTNKDYFMANMQYRGFDFGSGTAGFKKFTDENLCQGTYWIVLSNGNMFQHIDVNVKVVAIVQKNVYEDKQYTEQKINPRYEKKIFKDPIITTTQIPVTAE